MWNRAFSGWENSYIESGLHFYEQFFVAHPQSNPITPKQTAYPNTLPRCWEEEGALEDLGVEDLAMGEREMGSLVVTMLADSLRSVTCLLYEMAYAAAAGSARTISTQPYPLHYS